MKAPLTYAQQLRGWAIMCRIPFLLVGMLPLALGFTIAWRLRGIFDLGLFCLAELAVVLIMLSTHFAGECFDYNEDMSSYNVGKSRFAGGSGAIPAGLALPSSARKASIICILLAVLVGLVIQFVYRTGPWTIPLGTIGILGGFLYSTPPVRWVSTGFGELWIGVCYGFLPVIVGYYLPTKEFEPLLLIVSIPIAATIFNVILANEFPDFESDRSAGKLNLLVKTGKRNGARIYFLVAMISWMAAILAVRFGTPPSFLIYYSIPFIVSFLVTMAFLAGKWRDRQWLELMCGLGILVNVGTSLSFLIAFLGHPLAL